MMRPSTTALLILAAASPAALPAYAADSDEQFFRSVQGVWTGPGEIVAGKFKGTKFTCKLNGTTPSGKVGMTLDGSCRGYRGTFLDGAGGEGLDIVSGSVDGRKVTFSIARNQLNGAMSARIPNKNSMNVSVSVRVDRQMVRVIAMDLKRVDDNSVGAVASE
jgi:hypothetical protein